MNNTQTSTPIARFGAFEVNFQTRELRKHGMQIRVEEKPLQILEVLLERCGQLVTRETLFRKLWPNTHVSFDHGLNTAVNKLRDLLGDSAQNPRFVETLPRLGYRFIAPLTRPVAAATSAVKKMLAVLPFENLSRDAAQEYFADGLTEEMLSQLGQMNPKRLGVIARTSSIQYKATKKGIGEIARELKVDYVLEGSVRREGDRIRITAQLIEAQDQTHRWSASYDRDLHEVLEVQTDVARCIGKALALELLPQDAPTFIKLKANAHEF
jgi:TolB-like protein